MLCYEDLSKILDNAELLKILLIMKTSKHVYSDMPIQVSWKWSLDLVKKIMVWRKSEDFLGLDTETAW